jgi:hypothetical protein
MTSSRVGLHGNACTKAIVNTQTDIHLGIGQHRRLSHVFGLNNTLAQPPTPAKPSPRPGKKP